MKTKSIRHRAMDLLARREHSRTELTNKLKQRDFSMQEITTCLDQLEADDLLSNERFAEAYAKMRSRRGFGPVRIMQELKQRGISHAQVEQCLAFIDWQTLITETFHKKFADINMTDFKQRAKCIQFLNYRGYTQQQIERLLESK